MHPWGALGDAMGVQVLWGQGCISPGSKVAPSHQVWRVENQELVPVEKRWLGHFYGGDCYLVLYTYYVGPKVNRIIYIWQVRPHPLPRAHPQQDRAIQTDGPMHKSPVGHPLPLHSLPIPPAFPKETMSPHRVAMPVRMSWLPLPTKPSSWTRSTTTSLCRCASPWVRSRPT